MAFLKSDLDLTSTVRPTNSAILDLLRETLAGSGKGASLGDLLAKPGAAVLPGVLFPTGPGAASGFATPDQQTLLPRVRPGDVITADLINAILQMLETLVAGLASQATAFGPDVAALRLGAMAANTHTLLALGTGFEQDGGIFLDGQSLLAGAPARGVNLVILDSELNLKFRSTYDTLVFSAEAERLASDLVQRTVQYDVVIGMTSDAFSSQLTDNARAALASVGAEVVGRTSRARDAAAFIGVVPNSQTRVSFNYLASALPADQSGTTAARLTAQPFAWGLYSRTMQRFLLGGSSGSLTAVRDPQTGGDVRPGSSVVVPLDPNFGLNLPREVLGLQSVSIIKGIGNQRAVSLERAGVTNLALLAEAQPEVIAQAAGVGLASAQTWVNQAQTLLRG